MNLGAIFAKERAYGKLGAETGVKFYFQQNDTSCALLAQTASEIWSLCIKYPFPTTGIACVHIFIPILILYCDALDGNTIMRKVPN